MAERTIAVVDDEADIGRLLAIALGETGLAVTTFGSSEAFLAQAVERPPDLAVVDLMMPGLDGIGLVESLARSPRPPAIILMSGCATNTRRAARDLAEASGLKVVGDFAKPLDLGAVKRAASAFLLALEDGFRVGAAIAAGELLLHYQPIFAAGGSAGRRMVTVEALLRWRQPDGRLAEPGEFLGDVTTAEDWETLTMWVVDEAAAQLGRWTRAGFEPAVSINVPPEVIGLAELPDRLDAARRRHSFAPDRIWMEITECGAIPSLEKGRAALTRLKLRGYGLSIDDFGTGYSSLKRLCDAPFDLIKVDRAFVSRAPRDDHARSVLNLCSELARSLGMGVCAEGVDTDAALDAALASGCSHLQGFGLGRPSSPRMLEFQYAP